MEKRRGFELKLLVFFFGAIVILSAILAFSTAAKIQTQYYLGDIVKIDLTGLGEYQLKLITPSTSYFTQANESYFIFRPKEIGKYMVRIDSSKSETEYSFEVVEKGQGFVNVSSAILFTESSTTSTSNVNSDFSEVVGEIVVGKPVKWKKNVKLDNIGLASIQVPGLSSNISVNKIVSGQSVLASYKLEESNTFSIYSLKNEPVKKISLSEEAYEYEIYYETPAPTLSEKIYSDNEKEVIISSDNSLEYKDVVTEAALPRQVHIDEARIIKLYWNTEQGKTEMKFDLIDSNNDSFIESIKWITPHLSVQTFQIILINKAEHLDNKRKFVSDVYSKVNQIDLDYVTIPEGDYIRVVFERNLTFDKDITIYARSNYSNASVEVYEKDSDVQIATFSNVNEYGKYQIFLYNLSNSQDTFDLRTVGEDVEFDYIVDPVAQPGGPVELRAQMCRAQVSSATQYDFASACDGTYPAACGAGADLLSCNNNAETHTAGRAGGGNRYGGVNITVFNSSINDCKSINQVFLCYQVWVAGDAGYTCNIAVDSAGTSTFTSVTTFGCANAEPATITCVNVTGTESWNCGNFFGSSGNRAQAVAQAYDAAGGPNSDTFSMDVLFFNVSYNLNIIPSNPSVLINSTDGTNNTLSNLNCYANIYDGDADSINVSVRWYNNSVLHLQQDFNNSYSNGTFFYSNLSYGNTSHFQNWSCSLRLFDGMNYSDWSNSTTLNILNSKPTQSNPILNSTSGKNYTDENLTVYNISTQDVDGDSVKNFYSWYINNTPFALLSMPFEGGSNSTWTKDYSGRGNNGTVSSAFWNSSGGRDGRGAYVFDGTTSIIDLPSMSISNNPNYTISLWVKGPSSQPDKRIFSEGSTSSNNPLFNLGTDTGASNAKLDIYIRDDDNTARVNHVQSTADVFDNSWHHVVWVDNNGDYQVYVDGVADISGSYVKNIKTFNTATVGAIRRAVTSHWFNGSLDDIQIYNYSLSQQQISALYRNKTDLIVSQQTKVGEAWHACITPNDGFEDGLISCSNNVTISSLAIPPSLNITYPINASTFGDVTPILNISLNSTVDTLWYNVNNGVNRTICNSCLGYQYSYLHLPEGTYTVRVYANDSSNLIGNSTSTFTINMSYNYFDSFNDNTSIDYGDGATWNYGNISAIGNPVLSVQNYGLALLTGTASNSVSFTKSQNSSNVVPFVTKAHLTTGAGEDWQNHLTRFSVDSGGITATRASTSATLHFNISAVEFNPSKVRVQSGNLCAPTAAGCTTAIGSSVNRSRAFLIFYSQISGTIDDDSNSASILGNISGDNQLTFRRTDTTGTVTGTWYVVESLDNSFSVQNRHISLSGASSGTATINSVDESKTFLIASHTSTTATDDAADYSPRVVLSSPSIITATKGTTADNSQVTVFAVTFSNHMEVQRGTLSYSSGTSTVINSSLNPINTETSIAWNPTLTGRMQSDSVGADNLQSSYQRLEIINSTAIRGTRGLTVGNTQGGYEVIDFKPYYSYFVSKSINTTQNITRILNVSWNSVNSNGNNNISIELSLDNGNSFEPVINGQGLAGFPESRSLIYRALFNVRNNPLSLLDLNITWSNEVVNPPVISIIYPISSSTVGDVTPILNVSIDQTVDTLWYNVNNGVNRTICNSCSGYQYSYLHLPEGTHTVRVYANDSAGRMGNNLSTFTINMSYNYFDSFNDNTSIDYGDGATWSYGNISAIGNPVLSVQNYGLALLTGTASNSVSFTKSQNSSNVVPFVTKAHLTTGAGEDWQNHLTNFIVYSGGINATRASTSATLHFNISAVEFNPSKVRVQSGNLCAPTAAGCTTAIGSSVNRSRAFLIFYSQISGTIDDDSNMASILGNISGDNQLTFRRAGVTGTVTGRWYVVESLDNSFSVQNRHISLSGASSGTATINSVDESKTFLIASHTSTTATDDAADYSPRVVLSSPSIITATKGTTADNSQVTVFAVTFSNHMEVQRGTLSYSSGTSTVINSSLNPINTETSIAWNPTLTGRMQSDSTAADALQSSYQRLEIINSTAIRGTRGLTVGNTQGGYEVIDFKPYYSYFVSKSINTTQNIRQIVQINWTEQNTNSENNISVEVSANGGTNWSSATNGQSLTDIVNGTSLIYRVLFNIIDTRTISLLDLGITWSSALPPSITLIYPQNTTYATDVNSLNYTFTGENVDSCWYTTNNGITNTTISCGLNATGVTSNQGSNNWTVYLETDDNVVVSDSVTFFKDTISPNITLFYPSNNSLINSDTVDFNFTVIDNLDSELVCNITLDNEVIYSNISVSNGTNIVQQVSGLPSGQHQWRVVCTDEVGNTGFSEQRALTIAIQTELYRIVRGFAITSGTTTDVIISPPLNDTSKAFHFISYNHTFENDHADTIKSSEIINSSVLRIYGDASGGNNNVGFYYTILEFTQESPLFVQRDNITTTTNDPAVPIYKNMQSSVNTSESFLIYQGANHNAAETTFGNEEFNRIRLVNETTWEYNVGDSPNTNPQVNRMELVDWNDNNFVKLVQRDTVDLAGASLSTTITPPVAVNPNKTLLFVNYFIGTGGATSEPPSEVGVYASLNPQGNIVIQREVSGPVLSIAWQLVEFQSGAVKIQHIQGNFTAGQQSLNFALREVVDFNKTAAFGTNAVPFGHSAARASSTTVGAFDRNMFAINLLNNTAVRATRGDSTGTASLGIQIWEFLGIPEISNVNATDITSSSATIIWDTDIISNSSVRYGTNISNLSLLAGDSELVVSHSVPITDLASSTLYFFNVTSCNSNGCVSKGVYNFTTSTIPAAAPAVYLISPNSSYIQNSSSIIFYYNVSDINNNIANATLILNGQRNQTNQSSVLNNQINNITLTLPDGIYNWTVNVTDTTSLTGTNISVRNFTIDTRKPTITLYSPSPNQSISQNEVEFNFTVIDNLDNELVCDLTVNSVVVENDFLANNGSIINITKNFVSGIYFWNVSCIDDAGNLNTSLTRNFTITEEPPVVYLVTNNSTYSTSGNVVLVYNATDNNGLSGAVLILNGQRNQTNQSEIINGEYNNFTITLPEGIYNWTVNVTDTAGLNATNTSQRILVVDRNNPQISLHYPLNNTGFNQSNITFNFTATDSIDSSLICSIYVNDYSDINFTAQSGNVTNRLVTGLKDGINFWNVSCIDDTGRSNISINRIINVTEYPLVSLETANNSFFNTSYFQLEYTPRDNTGLSVCSLYIDGILNQTNQSEITNNDQNVFDIEDMPEGLHSWNVMCQDYYGLQNTSETRYFTVDLDGIEVSLLSPASGSVIFDNTVVFSYNVTDNIDNLLTCNININGIVEDTYEAQNSAITNRSIGFALGGLKYWNVSCVDDSSNLVISETRNFTLAFAPLVSLISPASGNIQNQSEIILVYDTEDDNDNIANATLILNGQRNQTNQSEIFEGTYNNFTLSLPDGYYNWTVNVTDTTNLEGTDLTQREFIIDTTAPIIIINNPVNNSLQDWNNITLNFTASDNLSPNLTCSVYINEAFEVQSNMSNGSSHIEYFVRPDGNYNLSVSCIDFASNTGNSAYYNFSVEAKPNVTLISPTNNFASNISVVEFNYLPFDPLGLTNCTLYVNGEINDSIDEPDNGLTNQFTVTDIPDGYYNWTVQCIDASPDFNSFSPDPRNLTVDSNAPNISLLYPINSTNVLRNVQFNFSALDYLDTSLSCNIYIDNNLNVSNVTVSNGTIHSINVSNISLGLHSWNVSCIDDANNINWADKIFFNVTLPDFFINPSSINFSTLTPKENENVTISVNLSNLANVNTSNIVVQFYLGNPLSGGQQIGSNLIVERLQGLETLVLNMSTNAIIGYNTVFVLVDPILALNGSFQEWNETNNIANSTVTVSAWQYVYGNINQDSEFVLQNNVSAGLISWATPTFDSANLYVSDFDSVIFWPNLKPIGKDMFDVNTTNDFADLDTLLNMTGLQDSIVKTYTNNTNTNFTTDTFMIFKQVISEVPVANSINNSNFRTGILWDTTKDTNGQFSTGDKEDIVFITKVNQGTLGAYGTYDYEIRVPAKLRNYDNTDSSKVSFYSEIH